MTITDISIDTDQKLFDLINLGSPKSFFLCAGAGSGKTRSLVNVLIKIKELKKSALNKKGQKVAVITYTNAVCDEIKRRLKRDPLFQISTIHSFAWELIQPHHIDIKKWVISNTNVEISDLLVEIGKGRPGTKTAIARQYRLEAKRNRLENLKAIRKFTYNPNGDNKEKDSLNHTEVISIAADILRDKALLQNILINAFPIILIDEIQDTQKDLIEAFLFVQAKYSAQFALGLFGDMMQRIYADGKEDLERALPIDWEKPAKTINYRCPQRIIRLINKIRSYADDHQQAPRPDGTEGFLRLFIVPAEITDKRLIENKIAQRMADVSGDNLWFGENSDVKSLILEHHMAARRMGFYELFDPLYQIDQYKTGLLDGSLSGLRFFTETILPLVEANRGSNKFEIARIVRQNSPLLHKKHLKENKNQFSELQKANEASIKMLALWNNGADPNLIDILRNTFSSGLFIIPENLGPFAHQIGTAENVSPNPIETDDDTGSDEIFSAWECALNRPFSELELYAKYISGKARFGTHQGVKGLEFPRVMVIIDDEEARGFMFSYDKLFGIKPPTQADHKNVVEGKETSIDRTRRLFYVTCSRAKESLAVVAYTTDPHKLKEHAISQGWFDPTEIEELKS